MRYHLHQRQGDRIVLDIEGAEYESFAEARRDAVESARELMASAILSGRDISAWTFEITNAAGSVEDRLRFGSTTSVYPASPSVDRHDTPLGSDT